MNFPSAGEVSLGSIGRTAVPSVPRAVLRAMEDAEIPITLREIHAGRENGGACGQPAAAD